MYDPYVFCGSRNQPKPIDQYVFLTERKREGEREDLAYWPLKSEIPEKEVSEKEGLEKEGLEEKVLEQRVSRKRVPSQAVWKENLSKREI